MARLWSCGAELQSTTKEWESTAGAVSISTSIKRTGNASIRCNPSSGTAINSQMVQEWSSGPRMFLRVYIYIASAPTADTGILWCQDGSGYKQPVLRLKTNRALQIFCNGDNQYKGNSSAVLSVGQWYRVELDFNDSTNVANAYLDGTNFSGAASVSDMGGFEGFGFGVLNSCTTDLYFDDLAVNDDSGTAQNSLPGAGSIVHLRPNAAGDNSGWAIGAGTGANWEVVDEASPDDATSYVERTSGQPTDDYNMQGYSDVGIGSSDTITLVQVGVRGGSTGTTAVALYARVKGQASGTVLEGSAQSFNLNGWTTNGTAANQRVYKLTAYTNPQTSTAWTTTTLNSMQAGIRPTTSTTTPLRVSTVWALVEFVPGATNQSKTGADTSTTAYGWALEGFTNIEDYLEGSTVAEAEQIGITEDVTTDPNFPNAIVEFATGDNYYNANGFTEITEFVRSVAGTLRGREHEIGRTESGSITVGLDNSDGRFTAGNMRSPYVPAIKGSRRFRIRGTNLIYPNVARGGGKLDTTEGFFLDTHYWTSEGYRKTPTLGTHDDFLVPAGVGDTHVEFGLTSGATSSERRMLSWWAPLESDTRMIHSAYIWKVSGTEPSDAVVGMKILYYDSEWNRVDDAVPGHGVMWKNTPTVPTRFVFADQAPATAHYGEVCVVFHSKSTLAADVTYGITGVQCEHPVDVYGKMTAVDRPNMAPLQDSTRPWFTQGAADIVADDTPGAGVAITWTDEDDATAGIYLPHMIPGETYNVVCEVYKTGGGPSLLLSTDDGQTGAAVDNEDIWVPLTHTFIADSAVESLKFIPQDTPLVGATVRVRRMRVVRGEFDSVVPEDELVTDPSWVYDSFSRTVSDGLGTADTGQAWTLSGTAANFDVNGETATIQPTTLASNYVAAMETNAVNQSVLLKTLPGALPASGYIRTGAVVRYEDASNYYTAHTYVDSAGVITLRMAKRVAGSWDMAGPDDVTLSSTHSADQWYYLKMEAVDGYVRAKLWRTEDAEPTEWMQTWSIPTADWLTGTQAGIYGRNDTAVTTHVFGYDDVKITSPWMLSETNATLWEEPKPIFDGWTEDWPAATTSYDAAVSINVVDRLGRLAQVTLNHTLVEALTQDGAECIIPLNESYLSDEPIVTNLGMWSLISGSASIPIIRMWGDLGIAAYNFGVEGPTDETALEFIRNTDTLRRGYCIRLPYSADVEIPANVPPPGPSIGPPSSSTHTKKYYATWSRSYESDRTTRWDDSAMCYQGTCCSGDGSCCSLGDQSSLVGFNYKAIMADLSGATIKSCKLTARADHWWYAAGGTAWIGTHKYTSKPSKWEHDNVRGRRWKVGTWKRDYTRTVDLGATVGAEFKSGASKGIMFGPAYSTSLSYYGYFKGATSVYKPYLTITYVK